MIRWAFLVACLGAVAMLFGVEPKNALYTSFVVLCLNFATFCLQYDDALNRAKGRMATQMGRISSSGLHAEEYHRLQSTRVTTTAEDRVTRYGPMTMLNIVSGLAGIGLLTWGLIMRVF
jgi:hypothetical protein